jgi:2-keto-4-pentenoate hydratase/2-oxohepta-3-ene-1,7-dioic acid hydratase in catechol pathway
VTAVRDYRVVVYEDGSGPQAGVLVGDAIAPSDAAWALWRGGDWSTARAALARDASLMTGARPLAGTRLLAPLRPGAVLCAAANYADHIKEMTGDEPPDKRTTRPYFFTKLPRTVVGPHEDIRLPPTSRQVDWEAEIGVVIGRPARDVAVSDAMRYVAGYVIVNDLSARDEQFRQDWPHFHADWFRSKTFDTSCPLGPWLTPVEAVGDPHALWIKTWINDRLMQDSSSRQMIFTIPEQIAYLSEQLTLQPGDVIATGTPAGCGRPRAIFLQPGDHIAIEIEGLGRLENRVTPAS